MENVIVEGGDHKAKSTQFHRTRMCISGSSCPRKAKCNYAHSPEELRSNQTLSNTKICRAFQQNKCTKTSEKCNFAHGLKQLVSTFGYFKTKRCSEALIGCPKAAFCRNYHKRTEQLVAIQLINKKISEQSSKDGCISHFEFVNYWREVDITSYNEFYIANEVLLKHYKNTPKDVYPNKEGNFKAALSKPRTAKAVEKAQSHLNQPMMSFDAFGGFTTMPSFPSFANLNVRLPGGPNQLMSLQSMNNGNMMGSFFVPPPLNSFQSMGSLGAFNMNNNKGQNISDANLGPQIPGLPAHMLNLPTKEGYLPRSVPQDHHQQTHQNMLFPNNSDGTGSTLSSNQSSEPASSKKD